ncbi:hypothetical protein [Shinella sp. NM-101]|uniref:hypothetical protein n=1 Tax=Shinella sp. NM-101 TaxID=2744455 RepID=UPI001F31AC5B|nr:hypothetical protein [Shinella sp. NM-101]
MSSKQPFDQFTPARWRGFTYPTDCFRDGVQQVVALSFDTPTGILRLLLDAQTADEVAHDCGYWRTAQSLRSSEIPNSEISPSDGQLQEPPATSSTAT